MVKLFKFMRNKRMFMLMLGVVLLVAVIGYSLSDRKILTYPEQFVRDAASVAQGWFYSATAAVTGVARDVVNLKSLHEEAEQLRRTVAVYTRDKVHYNYVELENQRLQKLLNFTEEQRNRFNYDYVVAQVVAIGNDANNRTLTINLGTKHGVETDMAVITVDGLVGIISAVSAFSSTVTPITELAEESPTVNAIAVSAFGKEQESFGILSSYNPETQRLLITRISEGDQIAEGDLIITSGKGAMYPRGLVVGEVEDLRLGDYGLTYNATVKMKAKMDGLHEVMVVIPPKSVAQEEAADPVEADTDGALAP